MRWVRLVRDSQNTVTGFFIMHYLERCVRFGLYQCRCCVLCAIKYQSCRHWKSNAPN